MLAGRIKCHVGHRHQTNDRAYINNTAAALATHMRYNSAGHTDYTEEIGIKNTLGLLQRAFFSSCRCHAKTCVIHQQIDFAKILGQPRQRSIERRRVTHVEAHGMNPVRAQFRDPDVVARVGGDEFLILLKGLGERAAIEQRVAALQARLMAPLAVAYERGYFEDEGLYVTLEAQANWKILLDRVIDGELDGALQVMEVKLLRIIINPAMIAAFIFGGLMIWANPALLAVPDARCPSSAAAAIASLASAVRTASPFSVSAC